MKGKPYYVLSGGYDTKNVGDLAMLVHLKKLLDNRSIGLQILSRHRHEYLCKIYKVDELIDNFEYENKAASIGNFFRGFNHKEDSSHLQNIKTKLEGSKGLIIGGGRLLIDYTLDIMRGPLAYFSTLVTLCKFLDIPVYIYAMTIVPCKSEEGEKCLRYIIDNAKSVAVRDQESVDYIRSIGCYQKRIKVIPDPAYSLGWRTKELNDKPSRVGLSVRYIHEKWGGMSENRYVDQMKMVVQNLQNRGIEVIGIPHQYYGIDNPSADDRAIFSKIAQQLNFPYIMDELLDLQEYQKIYSNLDFLIGIRRHSFIFAAVSGVPVLPFAENPNASRASNEIGSLKSLRIDISESEWCVALDKFLLQRKKQQNRQNEIVKRLKIILDSGYYWLFE